MKRTTWIAAVAAALVSTTVLAWSPGMGGGYGVPGSRPGMMGGGNGWGPGGCFGPGAGGLQSLNLSTEQQTQISKIFEETSAERLKLMEAMHAQRAQSFRGGGDSHYAAMKDLRDRMFTLHDEQRERVNAVLTPEQRAQLPSGRGRFAWGW